jgi:hypothetical protein
MSGVNDDLLFGFGVSSLLALLYFVLLSLILV